MNYNLCGNCDFCDKTRCNDKGQLRCVKHRTYKDVDDSCPDYLNLKKVEIYNKLVRRFRV